MYRFRAFQAVKEPELCRQYLAGHVRVLQDYGITNITSNNQQWMSWECVYGVYALDQNGTMIGGIRVQLADGVNQLPVEKAVGRMDPRIHKIVNDFLPNGVGELCALWNSKEVAGQGLSLLLTRAGISIANQIRCNIMMGICADYTMEMFRRVGFVVDESLGQDGTFVYPNENYVARVLGILNAKDLSTADDYDRERMQSLRSNPRQHYEEIGIKDSIIPIDYDLIL